MSITGAAGGGIVFADGLGASTLASSSGDSSAPSVSAGSGGTTDSVSVMGATPSGEGQPVVLFIDALRGPLEIDRTDDPLLVQAGATWTGRSASEVV